MTALLLLAPVATAVDAGETDLLDPRIYAGEYAEQEIRNCAEIIRTECAG